MANFKILITKERNNSESFELFKKSNLPRVLITNEKYLGISYCPEVLSEKLLRFKYKIRGNLWFPIKVDCTTNYDNSKRYQISRIDDKESGDGYLVVSKNDYRLQHPVTLHLRKDELKQELTEYADKFIDKLNCFLNGDMYSCNVFYGTESKTYRFIPATTHDELVKRIENNLDFIDDDFDEMLKYECNKIIPRGF